MCLSDIQNKSLVDMKSGKNIGNIVDIRIDSEKGTISSIIVEEKNHFSFLSRDDELEIKWSDIAKIGEDVILVDIK